MDSQKPWRYQLKPYNLHVLLLHEEGHCGQFLSVGIWLNHQAYRQLDFHVLDYVYTSICSQAYAMFSQIL